MPHKGKCTSSTRWQMDQHIPDQSQQSFY
jgi:hypothetical protein